MSQLLISNASDPDLEFRADSHYQGQIKNSKALLRRVRDARAYAPRASVQQDAGENLLYGALISGGGRMLTYAQIRAESQSRAQLRNQDPVKLGRDLSRKYGMRVAAEFMKQYLTYQDDFDLKFEKRFLKIRNAKFARTASGVNDTIYRYSPAQRRRTGIFLMLGMSHNRHTSPSVRSFYNTAETLRQAGFTAEVLPTIQFGTSDENATIVRESLQAQMPNLDRVILIAISKGANEMSHFFVNEYPKMGTRRAAQIARGGFDGRRGARKFSGQWMSADPESPGITRQVLRLVTGRSQHALKTLAEDMWADPHRHFSWPWLTWLSVAMIPGDIDGKVNYGGSRTWTPWLLNWSDRLGPNDGVWKAAGRCSRRGPGFVRASFVRSENICWPRNECSTADRCRRRRRAARTSRALPTTLSTRCCVQFRSRPFKNVKITV